MIECHCGKCERLEAKREKLKERLAELEDWKIKAENLHDRSLDLVMETWDEKLGVEMKRVAVLERMLEQYLYEDWEVIEEAEEKLYQKYQKYQRGHGMKIEKTINLHLDEKDLKEAIVLWLEENHRPLMAKHLRDNDVSFDNWENDHLPVVVDGVFNG